MGAATVTAITCIGDAVITMDGTGAVATTSMAGTEAAATTNIATNEGLSPDSRSPSHCPGDALMQRCERSRLPGATGSAELHLDRDPDQV